MKLEQFVRNTRHKHRYFRKRDRKAIGASYEGLIRVKYMGEQKAIADVWEWDNDAGEQRFTREISLHVDDQLIKHYEEITDPDLIRLYFTDTTKQLIKQHKLG